MKKLLFWFAIIVFLIISLLVIIEKTGTKSGTIVWSQTSVPTSVHNCRADAITLKDDSLYLAGYSEIQAPGDRLNTQWVIEKRNLSDGSLVEEFGSSGVVTINHSDGTDWAHAIVLDLDKSSNIWRQILNFLFSNQQKVMYIVGRDESPGKYDQQWRIEKRSSEDGSLISEFGSGGVVTVNPSKRFELANDIAIDENYIYVVGDDESLGQRNTQWGIVKIKK